MPAAAVAAALMNRIVHNRIVIWTLVVLLQVAMLPGQGRLQCMLRTMSLSCCCDVAATALAEGSSPCCGKDKARPSCCSALVPKPAADGSTDQAGDDGDGHDCRCGDVNAPPPVTLDEDAGSSKGSAKTLPMIAAQGALAAEAPLRGRYVAARVKPPACTGPPLHVLFEVFLI